MPESSDTLGPVIAAAIGLPTSNLISFTLRFTAQQPVRCDAEYLVPSESSSAISQIIGKSYDLRKR